MCLRKKVSPVLMRWSTLTHTRTTRVVAHWYTLAGPSTDECVGNYNYIYQFSSLCLTFASSSTGLAYNSSGRALWVGFLACESARIRAWPQDPPTPISLYLRLPTQLHGRATSRDLPPTSVSSSSFHYSRTHSRPLPPTRARPTAIHRHTPHNSHTMDLLNSYYPQEPSCARMPAL